MRCSWDVACRALAMRYCVSLRGLCPIKMATRTNTSAGTIVHTVFKNADIVIDLQIFSTVHYSTCRPRRSQYILSLVGPSLAALGFSIFCYSLSCGNHQSFPNIYRTLQSLCRLRARLPMACGTMPFMQTIPEFRR